MKQYSAKILADYVMFLSGYEMPREKYIQFLARAPTIAENKRDFMNKADTFLRKLYPDFYSTRPPGYSLTDEGDWKDGVEKIK